MSNKNISKTTDEERFQELFDSLDVNKDGKIEIRELTEGLKKLKGLGDGDVADHAQEIISKADSDENAELDFAEFAEYMQSHEQKLKLAFSDLDRNNDGEIDASEVQAALAKLGIHVGMDEAEALTKRLDKDQSLSIDWKEWRDFFTLCPSAEVEDLVRYWRKSCMIDNGELMTCPPDFTKKEKQTGLWWRHLVAGGFAGATSRTCTAPLDRIKTFLQVHGSQANEGIVGVCKQMIKEGGIKSMWRGNGTSVLKIAPETALRFAAYEKLKKTIHSDPNTPLSIMEKFASGSMAGAFSQSCIYPLEVVKTRLAVMKTGQYSGILDCLMKIRQQEGVLAFYKGYLPNLIGIIPYAGIDMCVYETLKDIYIARNPNKPDPGVMVLLTCGTLSSTCGQIASYPLALLRSRLQAGATPEARQGFVPLARHVLQTEGFRGMYRGILPNFLKVLPAVCISRAVYEKCKGFLGVPKN